MYHHVRLSILLFTLLLCTGARAQGIEFFEGTWAEALEKATAEDKLIFVDAYASWCGPCKKMSANVFPQQPVGDFHNANFVNVKFDMEKPESKDFRVKHSVRAYPTLFYINGKNEVVHRSVGGKAAETLIAAGNEALGKMDNVEDLAARWEAEDRTSKLAYKYIRAMVRRGDNHAKITNDYLREQEDLTKPDNLDILLVAATAADSRIFDLLVANRDAVVARSGAEAFERQVSQAVLATKDKAIEYRDQGLLDTAVDKYATVDGDAAKALGYQGAFELAATGKDVKAFYKATKKYATKGAAGDADRLYDIYETVVASDFSKDEKVYDMAIEAGAEAAALDAENGYRKYYKIAQNLLKNNRPQQALTYAQSAKAAAESLTAGKKKQVNRAIDALIGQIESAR